MSFGEQDDRFAAAVAPFLAARDTPLGCLERAFRFAIPAEREDACAIRQSSKRLMPRSIPVSCPVAGSDFTDTSTQEKLAYHPSASLLIVTVLGVPSKGRDQRTVMRPILERIRKPLSR